MIINRSVHFIVANIKYNKKIQSLLLPYLIFVSNAGNAMSVNFLAKCKKIQKNEKITALGSICRNFTHFPSVKK